jgi:hypothetical protein
VDKDSKAKLQQKGMTLITYPPEFYKEVRTQPGVIKLYQQIDQQTNGLGTLLMQELKKNA